MAAPADNAPPPPLTTNLMDRLAVALQLEKYKEMIIKRWWLLLLGLTAGTLYQGYKVYNQPDIYQATGSMM
ncbi:MAG: hypothetical protein JO317_06865, partial [Verrucomicrobiae bacterium]|nr:hypothetical protein [Verrucomicrobiae bacterium]